MIAKAQTLLKNIFGYDSFRPLQKEIITHVLSQKDTLVIIPTGGGKSLCYQIPALIFKGLTVVVSPLISLMKDQVEQLQELGVKAVFLNSSLPRETYQHNVEKIKRGEIKLLYVAPETLLMSRTLRFLRTIQVSCLTIDEAHCISEWGHDFRPEYRELVQVREQFPDAVCMALTATATPRVQHDIMNCLGFKTSDQFIASFNRENLYIQIVPKTDPFFQVIDFLEQYPDQSGIIYCFSRRQVDDLCIDLEDRGFSVRPYHAGLSDIDRKKNQELFIRDEIRIMVATIAFGMGINKPNVRFIIHHDLPKNIESYYQQIGRAGRDGLRAHCLLLFGYGDIRKINYFIQKMEPDEQRFARNHLDALIHLAETDICRRIPLLSYFGETFHSTQCGMCDNCLSREKELTDITIPAQMFLSCVKRTGERFGAFHIVDVLRGSDSQKIRKFNHQNLSTYGIGTQFSKKQWLQLSRQLITKGLLTKDPQHGSLKVTEKAVSVLKGSDRIMGTLAPTEIKVPRDRFIEEYDQGLFNLLRDVRKDLAVDADVPPYIIFSDKTLIQMAVFFPRTQEDFLQIHGVGRHKMEKYGKIFLRIIDRYCESNQITPPERRVTDRSKTRPSQKRRRYNEVGEAFNKGSSIQELMERYRVKQSTILNHLFHYFQEGNPLRSEDLITLSRLPKNTQKRVLDTFERLGIEKLRPVFQALNEEVNYEELHLLRLYFVSRSRE
jgi:ATP-dependent DNA helicase RecQ